MGIFHDITKRKQAEQLIQDEKVFSETLIQSLPNIFFFLDDQGNMLRWNKQFEILFELSSQEISGRDALSFVHEDDRPRVAQSIIQIMEAGSASVEARLLMAEGIRDYLLKGMRIETKLGVNLIGIGTDITERKENETTITHTNRALSLLSKCNNLLVHAQNEQEILSGICNLAVEKGGYLMAWVGFAKHDAAKSVRPVAQSGYEENYLENLNITWADTELGRGPTGTAIRTGRIVISQNILTNPDMLPWREAAIKHGYQSSIALPLLSNKQVLGALNIYAAKTDAFNEEKEVSLLEEVANDLAYGIITLRTRKAHERHSATLRKSLEQSIQTIAATVEARDPYTAGHQRRVGELSTAIAREMNLPEYQVNGIHLAAIIHDLGKIHVPAEILSKPGKLTDLEYKLIQEHPQAGYDILKNVEFPWPIAKIVLQHHERVDGSGYPQGLKGDAILLEAKIIAVADTVEAMSSHRPYRPGMGLESALEEIRKERGTHFDPAVVDACITLFEERDYHIPD